MFVPSLSWQNDRFCIQMAQKCRFSQVRKRETGRPFCGRNRSTILLRHSICTTRNDRFAKTGSDKQKETLKNESAFLVLLFLLQEHAHFVATQQQAVEQIKREIREETVRKLDAASATSAASLQQAQAAAAKEAAAAEESARSAKQLADDKITALEAKNLHLQGQLRESTEGARGGQEQAEGTQAALREQVAGLQAQLVASKRAEEHAASRAQEAERCAPTKHTHIYIYIYIYIQTKERTHIERRFSFRCDAIMFSRFARMHEGFRLR
eukprot:COSAG06_NODE_5561_length_3401_cov_2306.993640_3_plen_268_part_00